MIASLPLASGRRCLSPPSLWQGERALTARGQGGEELQGEVQVMVDDDVAVSAWGLHRGTGSLGMAGGREDERGCWYPQVDLEPLGMAPRAGGGGRTRPAVVVVE